MNNDLKCVGCIFAMMAGLFFVSGVVVLTNDKGDDTQWIDSKPSLEI